MDLAATVARILRLAADPYRATRPRADRPFEDVYTDPNAIAIIHLSDNHQSHFNAHMSTYCWKHVTSRVARDYLNNQSDDLTKNASPLCSPFDRHLPILYYPPGSSLRKAALISEGP